MSLIIKQYKWAGSWGPFTIKVPCGECSVSENIVQDVIDSEFSGEDILFEVLEWLPNWWRVIWRGGWHAPIITVDGKVVAQGKVIDRGLLAYHIRKALVRKTKITGSVVFSKPECRFCLRAKEILDRKGISYEDRNIIENPLYATQLFYLTKKFFPSNKPVTVPQVWIDGKYIGGSEEVEKIYNN